MTVFFDEHELSLRSRTFQAAVRFGAMAGRLPERVLVEWREWRSTGPVCDAELARRERLCDEPCNDAADGGMTGLPPTTTKETP